MAYTFKGLIYSCLGMAPRTGRLLKENGEFINEADLLVPLEHTFHDAATITTKGTILEVGNRKTLTVEIYGTSSSRTVAFIQRMSSGVDRPLAGVKTSDANLPTAISTTGTGEVWQFDVSGVHQVIMDLQAVAGGNVSVKGRVVA